MKQPTVAERERSQSDCHEPKRNLPNEKRDPIGH